MSTSNFHNPGEPPRLLSSDPGEAVVEMDGAVVIATSGTVFAVKTFYGHRDLAQDLSYNEAVKVLEGELGFRKIDAEAVVLLAQAAVQGEL